MRISDWSSDVCSSDLANRSGLLRSARNDGITDAKGISAKHVQGDEAGRTTPQLFKLRAPLSLDLCPGFASCPADIDVRRVRGDKIGRASCRERVWQYG